MQEVTTLTGPACSYIPNTALRLLRILPQLDDLTGFDFDLHGRPHRGPPDLPLLKGQTHKTPYVFKQGKPLIVLPVAGHSDNLPILLIVAISGYPAQSAANVKSAVP